MGLFDFFRKSKEARPIFEVLGTDMHCHLIPRVDDGSKSMEETLMCLKTMHDVGYKKVYITPHFQTPRFPNREEDILQRYVAVEKAVIENGLEMEMKGVGGEYRLDMGFVERVQYRELLTFGRSAHMRRRCPGWRPGSLAGRRDRRPACGGCRAFYG